MNVETPGLPFVLARPNTLLDVLTYFSDANLECCIYIFRNKSAISKTVYLTFTLKKRNIWKVYDAMSGEFD